MRVNANPHAFVEIADNRKRLGWYARAFEYLLHLPKQLSVRVIRFLQIQEAHAQTGGFFFYRPSSCDRRRTTNNVSIVDRAGRKPHCFSGSDVSLGVAVVAKMWDVTLLSCTLPS